NFGVDGFIEKWENNYLVDYNLDTRAFLTKISSITNFLKSQVYSLKSKILILKISLLFITLES
ncbi:MAG: hypothetical protein NWR97_01180, partial [Salibacteraceae bacterium]|nr:hypothetical protein [Salibacteraceae bacterium]